MRSDLVVTGFVCQCSGGLDRRDCWRLSTVGAVGCVGASPLCRVCWSLSTVQGAFETV
jgi:hypothetical protein